MLTLFLTLSGCLLAAAMVLAGEVATLSDTHTIKVTRLRGESMVELDAGILSGVVEGAHYRLAKDRDAVLRVRIKTTHEYSGKGEILAGAAAVGDELILDLDTLDPTARAQALMSLGQNMGPWPPVMVTVTHWREAKPDAPCPECRVVMKRPYRRQGAFPLNTIGEQGIALGDLLTFALDNGGEQPWFAYLLELGPELGIRLLFPNSGDTEARMPPSGEGPREVRYFGLRITSEGETVLTLITSDKEIDVGAWEQNGLKVAPALVSEGAPHAQLSWRTASEVMDPVSWGVQQGRFVVRK